MGLPKSSPECFYYTQFRNVVNAPDLIRRNFYDMAELQELIEARKRSSQGNKLIAKVLDVAS
jgi:hypothetical protein